MMNLKGIDQQIYEIPPPSTMTTRHKLRDVEAVTVAVFESLLSFIFGLKSQPSSWSLVSKMIQSKRVACEEETKVNDFSKVDAGLHSGNEYNQLDNLESCIQDHEERLQFPFRQLIKTRSSLLFSLKSQRTMAFHTRSNSFPSRPHPIVQQVDEQLSRLRSSETTSTSSISINHNLSSIGDLYVAPHSTSLGPGAE
ncbi:hypothetical protein DVH24_034633 [Malus domestica]|uniref:Uncharacterized protein n=1 Tax=Malus domestica TaxID=3750 RepID=A0A498J1N4_MALDO|nr:hypothetical protein DVH24_034633 [Malus domestica]